MPHFPLRAQGGGSVSVLVVGMSYSSASVSLLERVAVVESERDAFTARLLESSAIREAMLVSTCNRVEVYAEVDAFHPALELITATLAANAELSVEEIAESVYVRYSQAAAEHIFSVSSGLDSLVVGEQQIIGQIRSAYHDAAASGAAGTTLHRLAQRALHVGKRVHTETNIDSAGASMVTVALGKAADIVGQVGSVDDAGERRPLEGLNAAVIGAGAMGGLAVAHLGRGGVSHIHVLNRTEDRAARLAEIARDSGTEATALPMEQLDEAIAAADVVFVCTGAANTVVTLADVHSGLAAREARGEEARPLVICDLGLPRDVDPAVAGLPDVAIVDISQLAEDPGARAATRDKAIAREIVATELADYVSGERVAEVGPLISQLRGRGAQVVTAELRRFDSRNADLDAATRDEVERTVRRVVDKLLHPPTVKFKELAAQPGGDTYADIMRELFDLGSEVKKGSVHE